VTSEDWKTSIITPVFKKNSPFDPTNFRPISLLSNLFKPYERLIDVRIRREISLPPEQCAYRPEFSTETALLRLLIIFEYCKRNGIELFAGLLDLEQAFERAWRAGILYQLWKAGVRGKCWRVVKHFLTDVTATIRTTGTLDGLCRGKRYSKGLFWRQFSALSF
jgi:hypothetical protein